MSGEPARAQRVADQIQRELAKLIQQEMDDPRIGMVSVTEVDLSADLGNAKVYVTVLGSSQDSAKETDSSQCLRALNRAASYLRRQLAARLNMRKMPKLHFHYDESVSRGRELSALIDQAIDADRHHSE